MKDIWIEQERKIRMGKKGKRSKKIVSCIIVLSVLFLSVGGYFAYPTLADIVLPKRHVINAFINFGGRLQDMVDSLSEKLEFMEMEGELEIHLDAFPKLREEITIQDDSDKIHIRFWFESNKIHIRASQLFENDILMEINLSDITQLKQSNISGQLPVEYKQYQEACKKLDRVLHEISKMDFKNFLSCSEGGYSLPSFFRILFPIFCIAISISPTRLAYIFRCSSSSVINLSPFCNTVIIVLICSKINRKLSSMLP